MSLYNDLSNSPTIEWKDAGGGVRFFEGTYQGQEIHRYLKPDDSQVAGVTSAIGETREVEGSIFKYNTESKSIIDSVILNKAAKRGSRIHKGLEYYIQEGNGTIDRRWSSLEEAVASANMTEEEMGAFNSVVNQIFQGSKFKKMYGETLRDSMSEESVFNNVLEYAGTGDLFIKNVKDGEWDYIDFKFGREIPKGVGPQSAAVIEAAKLKYPDLKFSGRRGVIHSPNPGADGIHKTNFYVQGDGTRESEEFFREGDWAEFNKSLIDFKANNLKYPEVPAQTANDLIEMQTASVIENINRRKYGKDIFKTVYIDKDDHHDIIKGMYNEAAEKMGYQISETANDGERIIGGMARSGEGWNYTFVKKKSQTQEQLNLLARRAKEAEALGVESNYSLGDLAGEVANYKQLEIGDLLKTTGRLIRGEGQARINSLMSPETMRLAGIGGVIGYAAGAAYAIMHNRDDPTSTYEEDRNLAGNSVKGALAGTAIGAAAGTHLNMNPSRYTEEFVGNTGNMARGFCKMRDVITKAWKASGGIRR